MNVDAWQGAGEDWPDAYRQSPISPSETLGCVVCFWHHEWEKPAFQLHSSLLFGLPLAVTSFNRYSKLIEALGRRLLRSLVSMYFGDAHLTDLVSNGPSSQWAFEELNVILGTLFADDKRQPFAASGTFLGLDYDFATIQKTNCVTVWARERLLTKTKGIIDTAKAEQRFSPAQAAKLYGLLNFLENGMFGRVGCEGLRAIKDHQYGRSHTITKPLVQSFDMIMTILEAQPKRQFWLTNRSWPRVVVASDAAQDEVRTGSGGYVILWSHPSDRSKEAFVAALPDELFDWLDQGSQKIAQLEMLMIAHALVN